MPQSSSLIVFAKVPEPGKVKTRLTALLTPAEAARLYGAFLADALAQYQTLGVDVRLYLGPTETPMPEGIVPAGVHTFTQVGSDLGGRMAHAFVETFVAGYTRAIIIGTDHPTLPTEFLEEAFRILDEAYQVVVGPSEDGGFYLLGMNEFYAGLFDGMTYSHARVFQQTLHRAAETGAEVTVLPSWYDVDTPDELIRLAGDLPVGGDALSRTRGVLSDLARIYPHLQPAG